VLNAQSATDHYSLNFIIYSFLTKITDKIVTKYDNDVTKTDKQ